MLRVLDLEVEGADHNDPSLLAGDQVVDTWSPWRSRSAVTTTRTRSSASVTTAHSLSGLGASGGDR